MKNKNEKSKNVKQFENRIKMQNIVMTKQMLALNVAI